MFQPFQLISVDAASLPSTVGPGHFEALSCCPFGCSRIVGLTLHSGTCPVKASLLTGPLQPPSDLSMKCSNSLAMLPDASSLSQCKTLRESGSSCLLSCFPIHFPQSGPNLALDCPKKEFDAGLDLESEVAV